jgi:hypothetical protein
MLPYPYARAITHGVTNPFVQSLAGNFEYALRLMRAALTDCPDSLWKTDLWPDEALTDARGLKAYREDYCAAIREFHTEGKKARTCPLPFLIRHTAYHTMDHAREMEDKDLNN